MSSRLMPPNVGAIAATATIWSASCVARHIGQPSMSANSLNSATLPSMTGMAAPGPRLPSPRMAEPSLTTHTELAREVKANALSGSSAMAG